MFTVGQKVVCIDGSPPVAPPGTALQRVIEGRVYTVRGTHTEPHIAGYGVYLEEVVNSIILWSDGTEHEWPYMSERFRPVVEADNVHELTTTV